MGWGVVDYDKNKFTPVDYGAVRTSADTPTEIRLLEISEQISEIIDRYNPDAMSIEELFWNTNQKTGIIVAEARGVVILEATRRSIPLFEYTPLQVKQAVVGYGRADKKQVITMVTMMLALRKAPSPDDTADALALAICHPHSGASRLGRFYNKPSTMRGKIT